MFYLLQNLALQTWFQVRVPRDDFSIYDDMYDFNLENAWGQFKEVEENLFLQAPTVESAADKLKNSRGGSALPDEDDHLIQIREQPEHVAAVQETKRFKRAAVKKNLGSHDYLGSSMVAGKSADFLGSVTNSDFAINQALSAADKLRDAQRPHHRSPFPHTDLNETITVKSAIAGVGVRQETPDITVSGLSHRLGKFQTANNSLVKSIKKAAVSVSSAKIVKRTQGILMSNSIPGPLSKSKNSQNRTFHLLNVTKERQHLQSVMESDLNESVDQTLTEKCKLSSNLQF